MCSSYAYAYLIYEKWESRILDKILELVVKNKSDNDQSLLKRED